MDSEQGNRTNSPLLVTYARRLARMARKRAAETVTASQILLRSEDARWSALITVGRFTAHGAIVSVLVLTVILAGLGAGAISRSGAAAVVAPTPAGGAPKGVRSPTILGGGTIAASNGPLGLFPAVGAANQESSLIVRDLVLAAARPAEARTGIITYTVKPGDNVETIAQRFGLLPTTIVWSNREIEDNPDMLRVGQVLNILPVDGILYTVEANDTLSGIAERFKAKPEDILNSPLNNLGAGANLLPGMRIVVPGGVKPFVPRAVRVETGRAPARGVAYAGPAPRFIAGGSFGWPTRGYISQGFRYYHRGIDIANGIGVPIYASDGGYVTYAGWSEVGYGYMVQIDHGNGFSTLYAHLSQWYVDPGQPVSRGQIIGAMGSTGNSTGPHLHFEIRYNGVPQNPLVYLP
ncbi:MAG: peptidoglycan DD-metalloendopeptidase family protein [Thermoflexales bacterium]|nr:peptidoglycan DD-metalloendopeptidase family protein [Thermoflexales bacterium]